jgi:hypothetical protein
MLALLRQAKVRKYRLENLLLCETLVFLCIPSARVKDIMRLIRFGASPLGSLGDLSPKIMRRIEYALLQSVPGVLSAVAAVDGPCLCLELAWPELSASLEIAPGGQDFRVDVELSGQGQDVMEMARDASVL